MSEGPLGFLVGAVRSRWFIPVVVITAITLGLVGVVALTTTSAGCGKLLSKSNSLCAMPVARLASPSTFPTPSPLPAQSPVQYTPPAPPENSSYPPYNPGGSAYPPYNPGASSYPPGTNPASGEYPPFPDAASGLSGPQVALTCRLPVYTGMPGSGGFIVFPGGTFIADPRSAVTAPLPAGASPSPTPPQMYGPANPPGWWGLTYDARYSEWLPVPWTWMSPDGSKYAYPYGGDIYVVEVPRGTRSELDSGHGYSVLAAQPEGVYVILANRPGLWLLSYTGGSIQISASGYWQGVSNHTAYGTETSAVPQGATNTIVRLDVKSGTATGQFSEQGAQSSVVGFDAAGDPVIDANYQNGTVIFIGFNAGGPTALAYSGYGGAFPYGSPIADTHGLWFGVGQGFVLYSGGSWYWMSTIGGQLAGTCS